MFDFITDVKAELFAKIFGHKIVLIVVVIAIIILVVLYLLSTY